MTGYVEHNGKKYQLTEPTIKVWIDVMKFKDLLSEQDLYIKMIEVVTGLSKDEIMESDALTIAHIGAEIFNFFNQETKQLFPKFEHKGITYKLLDTNKITFGQFVDLDTFLKKDEGYRIANLNELAAYLYCEEGVEYGKSDFQSRIETMKDIPIKYIEGSLFFLLNLGKGLQNLSDFYSKSKLMWEIMKLRIALANFGAGIRSLALLPKTKSGKLMGLLLSPLLVLLTICLTLWTSLMKGIKSLVSKIKI
jgi:hypothetical protein